jgi:hypothetical protein
VGDDRYISDLHNIISGAQGPIFPGSSICLAPQFGGKITLKRPHFLADEVRTVRNNIKYMFLAFPSYFIYSA